MIGDDLKRREDLIREKLSKSRFNTDARDYLNFEPGKFQATEIQNDSIGIRIPVLFDRRQPEPKQYIELVDGFKNAFLRDIVAYRNALKRLESEIKRELTNIRTDFSLPKISGGIERGKIPFPKEFKNLFAEQIAKTEGTSTDAGRKIFSDNKITKSSEVNTTQEPAESISELRGLRELRKLSEAYSLEISDTIEKIRSFADQLA